MPKDTTKKRGAKVPATSPALTREQAAAMVDVWAREYFHDDDSIGDFLLLLRTLVYEEDLNVREGIIIRVEQVLMPLSRKACDAIDALVTERRGEWDAHVFKLGEVN